MDRVARARLLAIFQWPETAEAGALAGYRPRFTDMYRQRARIAVKIFRGAKPDDIPVEQPIRFELVIILGHRQRWRASRELSRVSPRSMDLRRRKEKTMASQIVMDATGDTRYEFNPTDAAALKEAEKRFQELTDAGFTAAVRTGRGRSELIRNFNPAAEETIFFPRLKGG